MGLNFDEMKDKVNNTVEDVKDSQNLQKAMDATKDVARKVGEISKDFLSESKRTIHRASEEIDAKIDKLRK